jgi:hypothetical protein
MSYNTPSGPDLSDPDWHAKATKAAEDEISRLRRKIKRKDVWPGRLVSAVLLVAILTLGYVMYQRGQPGGGSTGASPTSASPSTTPTVMIPDVVLNLAQPFVGTPAAGWPDGEQGIVAPAAQPVGAYTADQVAAAYAKVRVVVIGARLDRAVIEGGHDVERFIRLLAPDARANIRKEFANHTKSAGWATRIADGFRLLPVPPKVSGTMSITASDSALIVHTDYVVAYPFHTDRPDEIHNAMEIVAVARSEVDYRVVLDGKASSQGVAPIGFRGYGYSIACGPFKKGLLAPSYSERITPATGAQREAKVYFDPSQPMPTESNC